MCNANSNTQYTADQYIDLVKNEYPKKKHWLLRKVLIFLLRSTTRKRVYCTQLVLKNPNNKDFNAAEINDFVINIDHTNEVQHTGVTVDNVQSFNS